MRKKSKIFRNNKHPFRFFLSKEPGEKKARVLTLWAKVRHAKSSVLLRLTADDVRKSIKQKGAGNGHSCSMSICAKRQADDFPHEVEGYIDWSYSRAYVVSKVNKEGIPIECVVYRHDDDVAPLNDTPGGQKELLALLLANGDRYVRLCSMKSIREDRTGKKTGTGKKRRVHVNSLKGARLRFSKAYPGLTSP